MKVLCSMNLSGCALIEGGLEESLRRSGEAESAFICSTICSSVLCDEALCEKVCNEICDTICDAICEVIDTYADDGGFERNIICDAYGVVV